MHAPATARDLGAVALARGEGRLVFARVDGASALVGCAATTPLQILAPRRRGGSAWAVLASHGGGLVAGDVVRLRIDVGAGALATVSTQAEGKVYRSPDGALASQRVAAHIGAGAALAYVPHPVSLFAGARYDQRQRFDVAPGGSLLLVDAVVAGRTARGERWAFRRYGTRSEIRVGRRLVLCDALQLEPRGPGELPARLGRFDAFALVVALGPAFAACADALGKLAASLPVEPGAPILAVASPLPGGALLRCAAASAAPLLDLLQRAVAPAGAPLADAHFVHPV